MLRMLNDTILVRPDEEEYVDDNPEIVRILKEKIIELPEKYQALFKKVPMSGEVVSFGKHCKQDFTTGEKVFYVRFGGAPFNFNGVKYRILREYEILAKEE